MKRKTGSAPATLVLLGLVAAGCGGGSAGSSGSDDPIKIAFLGTETGQYATKDRHNGVELAIADINAKGGVNGRKLQYTAYDAGLTPEQGVTALKKALSDKPTVLLGLAVTAQVKAVAPIVKSSGLPLLHNAQSHSVGKESLGVDNVFRYGPTESMQTQALTNYILNKSQPRPKKVGLIASTDEGSQEAAGFIRKELNAGGITAIVERKVPAMATDLTEAVLAMRGTDATLQWSFPAIDSLFLRQKRQNGLTMPTYGDNSGSSILGNDLNTPAETANYRFVTACDPDMSDTPASKAYVTAYLGKFGGQRTNPQLSQGYDAVHIIAEAVGKAGSTDPKKLTEALSKLSYNGVCGTYQADGVHDMFHSDIIIDGTGGKVGRKLLARYDNLQTRAG